MKQTFLEFLAEARRNPEQNPKISINQQIDDYVDGSDPDNAFVSFTTVDKLGINPSSTYKTPLGIYAYPASYVIKKTAGGESMLKLPFAGESEFANLFRVTGNVVDLGKMSASTADRYCKQLAEVWAQLSNRDVTQTTEMVEIFQTQAQTRSLFPDYIGGQFWYVTMKAAELVARKRNISIPLAWNKLFRELGIDGFVDHGIGIIHTAEPTQAVFFSTKSIKDVKRVYNKYSPDTMETNQMRGDLQHRISQRLGKRIKTMSKRQILDAFDDGSDPVFDPSNLGLIKMRDVRLAVLEKHPDWVEYIEKPSIE
jgi:hypothetical protein